MSLLTAIQIEEDYLKLIGNRDAKNKFNLKDKLEAQGFSLEQYHNDKERFVFSSNKFKFAPTSPETTHDDVAFAIANNQSFVFVAAPTKTWMYGGGDNKKIPEGISFCDIGYPCESIFATDKDINLVVTSRQNSALPLWQEWLDKELVGIPHSSTIGAEKRLGNWSVYYFQIYFNGGREVLLKKWLL